MVTTRKIGCMSAEPTRPAKRRRFPREVRYQLLLDVAEKLFIEHGYAAVTMEDIAQVAGVTRPVVYNHFKTREGAYLACVRRARELFDARLLSELDPELGPRDLLARGGAVYFDMLEQDRGRWRLLFGSTAILPGTYSEELAALRFGTIDAVARLLALHAPNAPRKRVQAAAHAVSGVGERLGHWWIAEPNLTKAELVDYYTEILWAGLRQYVEV